MVDATTVGVTALARADTKPLGLGSDTRTT